MKFKRLFDGLAKLIANTCVKCIRASQNTEQHQENTKCNTAGNTRINLTHSQPQHKYKM